MEALVVVDMQKDFCYKKGALYVPDVEKIFDPMRKVVSTARKKMPVIFTQDWHRENDPEFKIWPKHCVANTWGAEVIDELEPITSDYFVKKRRYSAFFLTDLDLILRELEVEKLYVCGVVTNICVLHTAADAKQLGYDVSILEDCTKALSDYEQEYAVRHMKNVLMAKVMKSDEFIEIY